MAQAHLRLGRRLEPDTANTLARGDRSTETIHPLARTLDLHLRTWVRTHEYVHPFRCVSQAVHAELLVDVPVCVLGLSRDGSLAGKTMTWPVPTERKPAGRSC